MIHFLDMTIRFLAENSTETAGIAPVVAVACEEMSIGDMYVGKKVLVRRGNVGVAAELLEFRQEYE